LFKQYTVLFRESNKHHFWIDQSLFFNLHATYNIRYARGLELSTVTWVAQVLHISLLMLQILLQAVSFDLCPRILTFSTLKEYEKVIGELCFPLLTLKTQWQAVENL
jgi:hypothetical protein